MSGKDFTDLPLGFSSLQDVLLWAYMPRACSVYLLKKKRGSRKGSMHGKCELGSMGQDTRHGIIKDTYWSTCEYMERIEWYPVMLPKVEISWILRRVLWLLYVCQLPWCCIILPLMKTKLFFGYYKCIIFKHINIIKLQTLKRKFLIMENSQTWRIWLRNTGVWKDFTGLCFHSFLLLIGFRIYWPDP